MTRRRLQCLKPRVKTFDTRRAKAPPKEALPFYSSPEWRKLLARIIRERGRQCQDCGRTGGKIYGDHIQELRDGGAPLDPRNVWLRCPPCHGAKTARAKAEREAGQ